MSLLKKLLLNEKIILCLIMLNSAIVILNGFQIVTQDHVIYLESIFISIFTLEIIFSVNEYQSPECSFWDGFKKF